jgi:molybdenum cofactor sulfurtransferase
MDKFMTELRQREFSRLNTGEHVYLDYTGGGLYAESQIRAHMDMLNEAVLGNPHSENPSSLASTRNVDAARDKIREFFNADSNEYEVVFTSNASGALKLVGESYQFEEGSRYVLTADNHNSVNGIREFATMKGADVRYVPLNKVLRIDEAVLDQYFDGADTAKANLFAFPAQSNFTGVKHPLQWIEKAHNKGFDVFLDAAAFVPTSQLDLSKFKPDFVGISFYKMFGFPTGVGALIARRAALKKLQRPWFAGGTVRFASAQNELHLLQDSGEAFEDGTLNYISIAGVTTGLGLLNSVGMTRINRHVNELTAMLLTELPKLKHSNGEPILAIYGPKTTENRGGTIACNVLAPDGSEVDSKIIERRANKDNISLRTGCFCNPGAAEAAFHYNQVESYRCFTEILPTGFNLQQFSACMKDMPVGAVRISVGIATNRDDILKLTELLKTFVDCEPTSPIVREVPEIIGG